MNNDRKQKLINLGSDHLADTLIDLAVYSTVIDEAIERLIATPEENLKRIKKKISSLKRSRRFIDWAAAPDFARELEMLLQDIKSSVNEPFIGAQLVAAFYETDQSVFERCDDSCGSIGNVFRYDAGELFVDYAQRCSDQEKIADLILKVTKIDDYGVRITLIDCAKDCLSEDIIRNMIATLQQRIDKEENDYEKSRHSDLIESLAGQIKDAILFEKTRIASSNELSTASLIDIARAYLQSGDVETSHSWLNKIPADETFMTSKKNELLLQIYQQQGEIEKLAALLYHNFRLFRSIENLQALLDVIGNEKRDEVIGNEIRYILESHELQVWDAAFLISVSKIDEAEQYLLQRIEQLDGDYYGSTLPLAEAMASEKRHLIASLIYRCLLISILQRGYTKAYPHGIRYLKKLDKLSATVFDWHEHDNHETFKTKIIESHGRKRSFWEKYMH